MFKKCRNCGEYYWPDEVPKFSDVGSGHWCEPYEVYYEEYYGDEPEIFYGIIPEDVVERVAREVNTDDPVYDEVLFGTPIIVKCIRTGETKRFQCVPEIDVRYHISEEE